MSPKAVEKSRVSIKFLRFPLLYVGVALLYFSRAMDKGLLIASFDSVLSYYPLRLYYATIFFHHGVHLWLPYVFLGMPFLATMQTGLLYPLNLIYFILPAPAAFNFSLILHYALAGIFTFLYLRQIRASRWSAFFGGCVFGFSGFLMAHKDHISILNAAIWLPLLLYFYEKLRLSLALRDSIAASVVVALQILAGHVQICFQTYLVIGLFVLFSFRQQAPEKRIRFAVLSSIPFVLGLLMALPQIVSTLELTRFAYHAKLDFGSITEGSFPWVMLPLLFFPFLFGGGYGIPYWGPGFLTEITGFVGILPLVFGIWSLTRYARKSRSVMFWGIVLGCSFLLSLGKHTPVYQFLLHLPVFGLFRIPARHWFEFDFAVAVLSSLGLEELLSDSRSRTKNRKEIQSILAATMALSVAFVANGRALIGLSQDFSPLRNLPQIEQSLTLTSLPFLVPISFAVAYFIWLSLAMKPERNSKTIALGLIGLFLIEAFSFGGFHEMEGMPLAQARDYLNQPVAAAMKFLPKPGRFAYILNDSLNMEAWPWYSVPAKLQLLNAYEPLLIEDVRTLLELRGIIIISDSWPMLVRNNLVLSLLNTRYLFVPHSPDWALATKTTTAPRNPNGPAQIFKTGESWTLHWAFEKAKGYILKSPAPNEPSFLSQSLTLQPRHLYLLSLEARADDPPTANLLFTLSGNNTLESRDIDVSPPSDPLILNIASNAIGHEYKYFFKLLWAPEHLASNNFALISTFSTKAIEIRNAKVIEITHFNPPDLSIENRSKTSPIYREILENRDFTVFENTNCMPKAFSIKRLETAKDLIEIKRRMYLLDFNPLETALIYPDALRQIGQTGFSAGSVKILHEDTDQVDLDTRFSSPGFLVLADQYYPGWKALVDGHETPIYRVDGLLRGITVPAGKHLVKFKYRPLGVYTAAGIAFVTWVICLAVIFRRKVRQET